MKLCQFATSFQWFANNFQIRSSLVATTRSIPKNGAVNIDFC